MNLDNKQASTTVLSHNQYSAPALLPAQASDLPDNPLALFQEWFTKVLHPDSGVKEPEAVALSTVALSPVPTPSTRFVLLKQADLNGLVFFSNYNSRKGKEIAENPYASMAFYWKELSLSVRAVGKVVKVEKDVTQQYFASRPIGSRIGAYASPQSQVLSSRDELSDRVKALEEKFGVDGGSTERKEKPEGEAKDLEAPEYWGGYRLIPSEMEFWAGRANRFGHPLSFTILVLI